MLVDPPKGMTLKVFHEHTADMCNTLIYIYILLVIMFDV